MRKIGFYLGGISGVCSLLLWLVYSFFNPYDQPTIESIVITFLTLIIPACLAIVSACTSKKYLMLIAFLWSLPISLYVMFTPGIFALYGVTSVIYLISFLLIFFSEASNRRIVEQQ